MDVFGEYTDGNGKSWKEANSKTYNIQDIIDYLRECQRYPQSETKVHFTIKENGDLLINTRNDDIPGTTEGSGFPVLEE